MTTQEYFEQALRMEEGDTMLIPCASENEQQTVRVRLFQLRKAAKVYDLMISKETIDGVLYVTVKKSLQSGAVIIKQSGQVVSLAEKVKEENRTETLSRIVELAIKDGMELDQLQEELCDAFSPEEVEVEYNKLSAQ
jgi:hypothetical protein